MPDFDTRELRTAFGSYLTGVTVVTCVDANGTPFGFTANSFSSVSMDPPLLLVCPGNHLSSFDVFRNATHFAVNILAENQERISNLFASSNADRFAESEWEIDANGVPVLAGVAAHFSCATYKCVDAGDHVVLIGEVKEFSQKPINGLGFAQTGYFSLTPQSHLSNREISYENAFAGAVIEHDGHVLVQERDGKYHLPSIELDDPYHAPLTLQKYLKSNGLDVEIGQTYSIFDDPAAREHFTYFRANARSLHPSNIGTFVKIEDLDTSAMNMPAIGIMMKRFQSEHSTRQFGLFIGDTISGDVRFSKKP